MLKYLFHHHKWTIIDKEILQSPVEQMQRKELHLLEGPNSMFRRKYILVLQCSTCGQLKIIVEANP